MNEKDFEKIDSMIARHVGVFAESVQRKFDILVEGHQMLSEKLDRVEMRLDNRIDCVVQKLDAVAAQGNATAAKLDTVAAQVSATSAKLETVAETLDAVAADLKAHRADTEAHHPVYRVKE
jgi:ABC-type transporter Mla subunit MlaD